MKKVKSFQSLLNAMENLEETALGKLKGGIAMVGGNNGLELDSNGGICVNNGDCSGEDNSGTCTNNTSEACKKK